MSVQSRLNRYRSVWGDDISPVRGLLAFEDTIEWFLRYYCEEGALLLRTITIRFGGKKAQSINRAFLVSTRHWAKRGSRCASRKVVGEIARLVNCNCPPGRILDYLQREGNAGADLIASVGFLIEIRPDKFSSKRSLISHSDKHGEAVSAGCSEDYLMKASAAVKSPHAKRFLAYHVVRGRKLPRLCCLVKDGFVAINGRATISTFFDPGKPTKSFILEKNTLACVLPLW